MLSKSRLVFCFAALFLLSSVTAWAQALAREALAAFPPGTQQFAYADLATLKSLPNYRQVRNSIFTSQMFSFERFLGSVGIDAEKQVNQVALGWRGGSTAPVFFGLAEGEFDPSAVEAFVEQEKLPTAEHAGYTLYAFGPADTGNLFFTFLNTNLAAFGRVSDLNALIDGYLGARSTLASDAEFAAWESEMEDSGPEWGITTGTAAASVALPWLIPGSARKADLGTLLAPVKAVLYAVNWDTDFSVQVTVICKDAQSASSLARLLSLARDALSASQASASPVNEFVQDMEISADGARIEIAGSGPPAILADLLRRRAPGR